MKRWGVYLFLAVASLAFAVANVTGTLEYSQTGAVVFSIYFLVYVTVVGFNWRFLAGARREDAKEYAI